MVAGWGVRQGYISKVARRSFLPKEAIDSFLKAKWEVFLPAFILIGIFGGFTTFSTFGYEFVNLIQNQQVQAGILYILLSHK